MSRDLDDDTINALNAEVRAEREQALSEEHLTHFAALHSDVYLRQAATNLRIFEALRKEGR